MAQQWNMKWFGESAPMCLHWLHALTFPIKHPSAAALMSTFDDFKLKEPQMSNEQPQTTAQDAVSQAIGIVRSLAAQNNTLLARIANQRATIEKYQGRILELEQQVDPSEGAPQSPSEPTVDQLATLQSQLARALHTQKILERDLEEYQQAYADLKASVFSDDVPGDDEDENSPRLLEFGHGHYLVYPAKVCLGDDDQDPKWGIVVDPTPDVDVEEYLKPLAGKDVVLTAGDVAITFQKPEDVARLIDTLDDLRVRWLVGIFAEEK